VCSSTLSMCAIEEHARARPLTSEIIRAAAPREGFAPCRLQLAGEIAPAYSTNEATFHIYILLGKMENRVCQFKICGNSL